mgnify:CR=1 FL=1
MGLAVGAVAIFPCAAGLCSSKQSYSSPRLLQVLKPMDFRFHTSFLCEGTAMVMTMACELTFSTPLRSSR